VGLGGSFSSAVGLTISLAIEIKISKNYLQVMEMDEHFKTADFENNIL
jgi:glucose-6-phosphate isomerase